MKKTKTILQTKMGMRYNANLAEKVRNHLLKYPGLKIEEKKMFRGLTFMVNDKMCISVSGEKLMCRFDPAMPEKIAARKGFQPMIMKGKEYKGLCNVEAGGFKSTLGLKYWIDLCLEFNPSAKASRKNKP